MKIHQIHETGGEWEDSYDNIVSSHLNARKAEVECQKLRVEENKRIERARKCNDCPLYRDAWSEPQEQTIKMTKRYCQYYEYDGEKYCANWESDMEERHFDVREVKVIE